MAKEIKFPLICDGQHCRTIEDLQEHFSVNDILEHYKSGKLHKWLENRDYSQLEAVNNITCESDEKIIAVSVG